MRSRIFLAGAVLAAAFFVLNPLANATPYASGVSVNAGVVTFILNEAADNVTVVFDGGASSQDLGALNKGTHTFNMGAASSFEIVVTKNSPPWELISNDTNRLLQFNSGRGVAVNLRPGSPYFGRIYVANSAAGTASGRSIGDGIYILNADQTDALGRADIVSTGGIVFNSGGGQANNPWHIEVGPDDYLYIADFSTNTGTIYRTDPDVSGNSGEPVLANYGVTNQSVHTTIGSSPIVLGSLAGGDMVVYAIDGQFPGGSSFNTLYRWDIGGGPLPYSSPPTKLASPLINSVANVTTDLDRAPDGKFFMMQNRSVGNESGIVVVDTDGTTILWRSLTASREILSDPTAVDILRISRAVKISPDNNWMAIIRDDLQTWVVPLTNGIPDLAQRELVQTHSGAPTTLGRDVCFDAAGNLYTLSSGNLLLRIFSPGGLSTNITRSDGTFSSTVVPLPAVSVTVTDADGAEEGEDPISFTLTRNRDLDEPLTVNFNLTGLASNGIDYVTVPLSAQFPIGESNITITLTPIDDSVAELSETVRLDLVRGMEYGLRAPTNAVATILDNEFPALRLTGGSRTNVYEPLPRDTMTLTVSRLGRVDLDIFQAELITTGGTAVENEDFLLSTNLFGFAPGQLNQTVTIAPLNDFTLEGNETVVVSLGPGSGDYSVDDQNSVTRTIRDDDQPPAPVLFSEDFTSDASANWQIRFGANNGIYDATVNWQYDYTQAGVGPAPNTQDGSSSGLYATVNKTDSTAGGSAGINFYPIGQSFSGDYALRFDMYLGFGTASTTEHAMLGINHSGNNTNRATQSAATNTTAGGDGFWVGIVTDASNLQDYSGYTYPTPTSLPTVVVSRAASTLTGLITSPPYALAGSPGSNPNNKSWAVVELSQVSNLISLKVNDILIWEYQNTSGFTSGNIMIGMSDQFDSVPAANAGQHFVVFDNVHVVNLSTDIEITSVELLGANQIQIDFTSPSGGDASGYTLRTKGSLTDANWSPDPSASITSLGGTEYRAVATRTGGQGYYIISKP